MTDYVSTRKDEKAQATVENLLANLDSKKFNEGEKTFIKRLKNRRFIQESEYEMAKTLEKKL
jgi:hypothetical protein